MEITLNNEQRLFVLNSGNSVSCLGFQVVFEEGREMLRRLAKKVSGLAPLLQEEIGTLTQYKQYSALMSEYCKLGDEKTWFDARTPKQVQTVLEEARKSGRCVRLYLGDAKTGRDWLEEHDTTGRIGRSMGPMRSPLLILPGQHGGGAILTACLVRIQDVETGEDLYKHKTYHLPDVEIVEAPAFDQAEGFRFVLKVRDADGAMQYHSRYHSTFGARLWLAYMAGARDDGI